MLLYRYKATYTFPTIKKTGQPIGCPAEPGTNLVVVRH
jgi:hypothetical protein